MENLTANQMTKVGGGFGGNVDWNQVARDFCTGWAMYRFFTSAIAITGFGLIIVTGVDLGCAVGMLADRIYSE